MRRAAFIVVVISAFCMIANCGRQAPPPKEDIASPIVIGISPSNQSIDNSINTVINIRFNEAIEPRSLSSETLILSNAITGKVVPTDIICTNALVDLIPRTALETFTVYVIQITTGVRDIAGNAMLYPLTSAFTTGSKGDLTPPEITLTDPVDGSIDVDVNSMISVAFTEQILSSTVTTTPVPIILTANSTTVEGNVSVFNNDNGSVVLFSPAQTLDYAMTYTVMIADTITDLAGNRPQWLNNVYSWQFTTRAESADMTRPYVVSTFPARSAENVSVNAQIIAVFNETMMSSSVTATTFLLAETKTSAPVQGNIVSSGSIATFTPAFSLKPSTAYLVTLVSDTAGSGMSDAAGNLLLPNAPQGYVWQFMTEPALLLITKMGTGSGVVTASTGTLTWTGNTGMGSYPEYGTLVTLTAAAGPGSTFSGWSGEGCSGTGVCMVTMTQARNIIATFMHSEYPLTVTKEGTGRGMVTTSTGTLTWTGNTGIAIYPELGTIVTLAAAADTGSTFTGWSGEGCTGTGTCAVTMIQARSVIATFMVYTFPLTVTESGNGIGTVTADKGILAWNGRTGTASYDYGTTVVLTARADPGMLFTNWAGCDSAAEALCTITLTAPKSVTATFARQPK